MAKKLSNSDLTKYCKHIGKIKKIAKEKTYYKWWVAQLSITSPRFPLI